MPIAPKSSRVFSRRGWAQAGIVHEDAGDGDAAFVDLAEAQSVRHDPYQTSSDRSNLDY